MVRTILPLSVLLAPLVFTVPGAVRPAEPGPFDLGDTNGDGRVSFADAVHYARWLWRSGPELAEGSGGFEGLFDCTFEGGAGWYRRHILIEHEALRRLSEAPLPHILERWPAPRLPQGPAPPSDPRVVLELMPAIPGLGGQVSLGVILTTTVPLEALQLVLRGSGVDLRPATERDEDWNSAPIPITYSGEYSLITGGLLVYHTALIRVHTIPIGDHLLELPAQLPRGTTPGTYEVRLREGTEAVVSGTKEVITPDLPGSGVLHISDPVLEGAPPQLPPLHFDEAAHKILGKFEIRATEAEGRVGDEVAVRVSMRAERPVNLCAFHLSYDGWALRVKELVPLYPDPRTGLVQAEEYPCGCGLDISYGSLSFTQTPPWFSERFGRIWFECDLIPKGYGMYDYPELAGRQPTDLEYMTPLDEWVDLFEARFEIRKGAVGRGPIALELGSTYSSYGSIFIPYSEQGIRWSPADDACSSDALRWTQDLEYVPGSATAPDEGEPVEPSLPVPIEEAGVRFYIGDGEGAPGDLVALPVIVTSAVDVFELWTSLAFDPEQLELVGFEVAYVDPDGLPDAEMLLPLPWEWSYSDHTYRACVERDGIQQDCRFGHPESAVLHGPWKDDVVPEGVMIAKVKKDPFHGDLTEVQRVWRAGEVHEIGRAVFRIRDDAPPGVVEVGNAIVEWRDRDHSVPFRRGCVAKPIQVAADLSGEVYERFDVPAESVGAARVRILGGLSFRRGDANLDARLDLSDAVHTLASLFLGGTPLACEDAADSNDDGALNISDGIYSLGHLFLGGPPPPPPYLEPGRDPTADSLGCEEGAP